MKKQILLIFVLLVNVGILNAQKATETDNITVMSYNIRNGMGMDNITDLNRTALLINDIQPDLLAVQEVDSMTGRNNLDVLKELAVKTRMHYTYAPAIHFDGGKYGIGLLSKESPVKTKRVALPGREEARILLVVEFEKYVMMCTHLSLTAEDQSASVAIINQELRNAGGKPVFLAGDLNILPSSEVIEKLGETFTILSDTTNCTYPADVPTDCIDYIMIGKKSDSYSLKYKFVYNEPLASDHRPIVVRLSLSDY